MGRKKGNKNTKNKSRGKDKKPKKPKTKRKKTVYVYVNQKRWEKMIETNKKLRADMKTIKKTSMKALRTLMKIKRLVGVGTGVKGKKKRRR